MIELIELKSPITLEAVERMERWRARNRMRRFYPAHARDCARLAAEPPLAHEKRRQRRRLEHRAGRILESVLETRGAEHR